MGLMMSALEAPALLALLCAERRPDEMIIFSLTPDLSEISSTFVGHRFAITIVTDRSAGDYDVGSFRFGQFVAELYSLVRGTELNL